MYCKSTQRYVTFHEEERSHSESSRRANPREKRDDINPGCAK